MIKVSFKRRLKMISTVIFIVLVLIALSFALDFSSGKERFGATFSQYYAGEIMGLDWRAAYTAILDELRPKLLRLVAYWQYIETEKSRFDFADLDWQVKEAASRGASVTLVFGHRVPRWPECHSPEWAKGLSKEEFRAALLQYEEKVVERYKKFEHIKAWQVENEPLLSVFGDCPRPDVVLLKKELELVRQIDPARPIVVTDSGELSLWLRTSRLGDILGTTFYRVIWDKYFGWLRHYYPPVLYTARGWAARNIFGVREVIVSELQAEPWTKGGGHITSLPLDEQIENFTLNDFATNVRFARATGFKEIYLWGVEWWYWRKVNGDASFWDFGRELFGGNR